MFGACSQHHWLLIGHDLLTSTYIDLYRVEDEKIAEHWGFSENIPPERQWKNNSGVL
jgi:predicted SnoaL-like aldol condensation-catalyzing enzyme